MEIKTYTSFNDFEKNYKEDYDTLANTYNDYTYELYLEELLDKYSRYYEVDYFEDKIIGIADASIQETQTPKLIKLLEVISILEENFIEKENINELINNHTENTNELIDFGEYSFLINYLCVKKDYYDFYLDKKKRIHIDINSSVINNLHYSFDKIIRYIEYEINNLKSENEYLDNIPIETKGRIIDKVIYLNELGIIDFFKTKPPYNTSINKIAEVISLLIDEKRASIQPYINDLINKNEHSKNYPYNSQNKVNNIKKDLIERGLQ